MTSFMRRANIRFAHCDPAGLVFFPQFLVLVNEMVEDWFAGPLNSPFRDMHVGAGMGAPTVSLTCTFLGPARLGDVLDQSLSVVRIGNASCELMHKATMGAAKVAEFSQTLVHVSLAKMRSEPWPDSLRKAMERFLEKSDADIAS